MCFGLERMEGLDGFSYTRNVSCGFAPDLFFHEFDAFLFGDRNSHFDAVVRLFIGMEELRHSECWDSESILAKFLQEQIRNWHFQP